MILDDDLTVLPEEAPKFWETFRSGKGEFITDSRLVYPMEDKAVQFLNPIANRSVSIAFSGCSASVSAHGATDRHVEATQVQFGGTEFRSKSSNGLKWPTQVPRSVSMKRSSIVETREGWVSSAVHSASLSFRLLFRARGVQADSPRRP